KHPKAKKGVVFGLLVTIAAIWVALCQPAQDIASFDILFPQNWYTCTLQSCMEVWSDLDCVIGDQEMPFERRHLFIDAAIGKIAYCSSCFENRVDHSSVDDDDISYLMRIVG